MTTKDLFDLGAGMMRANAECILGNRPFGITPQVEAIPRNDGPLTIEEAIAALDLHAARAARRGDYGCHADLTAARELLDKIAEAGL